MFTARALQFSFGSSSVVACIAQKPTRIAWKSGMYTYFCTCIYVTSRSKVFETSGIPSFWTRVYPSWYFVSVTCYPQKFISIQQPKAFLTQTVVPNRYGTLFVSWWCRQEHLLRSNIFFVFGSLQTCKHSRARNTITLRLCIFLSRTVTRYLCPRDKASGELLPKADIGVRHRYKTHTRYSRHTFPSDEYWYFDQIWRTAYGLHIKSWLRPPV